MPSQLGFLLEENVPGDIKVNIFLYPVNLLGHNTVPLNLKQIKSMKIFSFHTYVIKITSCKEYLILMLNIVLFD